jgi:DNA-binding transcriptional LysR family regulator
MSNIKYLAYLKTIEMHSLTKAAEYLGYTQPGISHMISSLEQELGFPLLIRAKDGVLPTEEASHLLYYMRQIVNNEAMLKDLANQILGIETGTLRIGLFSSTSTQWMPALLQKFTAMHPNINVQLIEGTTIELQNLFKENLLDLALMSDPAPEGFEFIPLMQDPILAIIPQNHPLASRAVIEPKELIHYPFIIPQEGADEDVWRALNPEKLTPTIKYRIKGDATILAMIAYGLGVSLFPELAILLSSQNILKKPLSTGCSRTLGIVVRSSKYASPAVKEFLELTRNMAASNFQV